MALVYNGNDFQAIDSPLNEEEWDEAYLDSYLFEHSDEEVLPRSYLPQQPGMFTVLTMVIVVGLALITLVLRSQIGTTDAAQAVQVQQAEPVAAAQEAAPAAAVAEAAPAGAIAPLFTAEVQHWAPQIITWSAEIGVDPNMAATIMQVESCGDPNAVSIAGAQGLFQVMPFHFTEGEPMQDPDTNARKGLRYFADRLVQTNGDVGRAFAGYNGGHVAAGGSWDNWYPETQRYYTWTTGIFADAQSGSATSETLNKWLAAGGASLCRQAAQRIGLQ